jgi:RHS repeat-associated protein
MIYDGGELLATLDGNFNRVEEYVQSGATDHPFAVVSGPTSPTAVGFPMQDAVGNVVGVAQNGTVVQSNAYDAWGSPAISGATATRLLWKGLAWEGDTVSLYYVRNRWYDPESGRFMNEDPIGLDGGNNLYTFGGNDPINTVDPSGTECFWVDEVVWEVTYYKGVEISRKELSRRHLYQFGDCLPGDTNGANGEGPSGNGAGNAVSTKTRKPSTDWAACLTQGALLAGTLYLDFETFGEMSKVRELSKVGTKFAEFAKERKKMKAIKRALAKSFQSNMTAAEIVDQGVADWRQQMWAMGPASGIVSWTDAASLVPFGATISAVATTYQTCQPQ